MDDFVFVVRVICAMVIILSGIKAIALMLFWYKINYTVEGRWRAIKMKAQGFEPEYSGILDCIIGISAAVSILLLLLEI